MDALRGQTLAPEQFEVVVAIDGSDDGTFEAIDGVSAPFAVRSVAHPRSGRAATVNAGAKIAQGALLVILDDDMEPAPQLLQAHREAHATAGRPVAVVGAAPVVLDQSSPPFARWMGGRFNDVLAEMSARGGELRFDQAYTGNFSVARADFEAVGGFDRAFSGYGLEDYELALRLARRGLRLVLDDDAIAHQHYEKPFADATRDSSARARSSRIFATLHPEHAADVLTIKHPGSPSRMRRAFRHAPRGLGPLVIVAVRVAERMRIPRLEFAYQLGLEYFFVTGIRR